MEDTSKNKLVTIGGGKGQAAILRGLKQFSYRLDISAIVSMVDDGGSTGKISKELEIPPFGGDFKDVLTALSHNKALVKLWHHRYEHGSEIKGHTVGNLILIGLLEQADWNIPEAIKIARQFLDISASVYPSTLGKTDLVAKYEDGDIIKGQNEIDNNLEKKFKEIIEVFIEPKVEAYDGAVEAIKNAEVIVLCPGDIYGSLICNLVVPGISEAIAESQAKIVYITNLMTKVNQTHNWAASRFITEIQKYLPRKIDYAIINDGELPETSAGAEQYKAEHWEMVECDIDSEIFSNHTKVIKGLISYEGKEFKRVSSDVIPRSFIRHDPKKIAEIIVGNVLTE